MIDRLTPEQLAIVRHEESHLLVTAGAGTGKTGTVVAKILYHLGVPVEGERIFSPVGLQDIVAITFTIQAAGDLKRKLREALAAAGRHAEAQEVDTSRIGTIHAFTYELLREYSLQLGHPLPTTVLDENQSPAIVLEAVRDGVLRAVEARSIPGVDELLIDWSMRDIEQFVLQLVDDGDRLLALAARQDELGDHESTLVRIAGAVDRHLNISLRARSAVDFDRMVLWTRDLLRERPDVLEAVRRRVSLLIVDEFQDTDPAQRDLAFLIGGLSGGPSSTRLMLVGDPKQSIYRFRRADVAIWNTVNQRFVNGAGRVMALTRSFRSRPDILAFVDHALGPILDEPVNGLQRESFEVPAGPVTSSREIGSDPGIEIHVVPPRPNGKPITGPALREIEAATVARRAVELHREGVPWRGMAVLLPTWAPVPVYRKALERENVPSYALQSTGFYGRREIVDLVLALRVMLDPRNDLALFGFLRSPFVGVRDETLLRLAAADSPRWEALGTIATEETSLIATAVDLIERYAAMRDRIPTHVLLENLVRETGFLAHLALWGPDGDQAMANVRKFLRLACRAAGDTTAQFLLAYERARELDVREGDAPRFGESDDVVTITTVHSAKGLEWDVVFWSDLTRTKRPMRYERVLLAFDDMRLAPQADPAGDAALGFERLRERLEAEEYAETKRLWYVAATRAKDLLVLPAVPMGSLNRHKQTPASQLKRFLPVVDDENAASDVVAAGGASFPVAVVRSRPRVHEEPVPVTVPAEPEPLPAPAGQIPVRWAANRHSATEFLRHHRCARRHWFTYLMGLREPEVEREADAFIQGVARGNIVHDVLEHIGELDELDDLLEDAIGRWDPEAPAPDQFVGMRYRAHLADEIERVVTDRDYRSVADLPGARRELRFIMLSDDGTPAVGAIDLAAADEGGATLLDVKTNQIDQTAAPNVAARYAAQRDFYVNAVSTIGQVAPNRFAFQFSHAGVQVSNPVDDEARRRAAEEYDRTRRTIGDTREMPPVTSHPAECAFCGFRRVGWCPGAVQD